MMVRCQQTNLCPLSWALIAALLVLQGWAATATATMIRDLRTDDNPGFVRLVVEFDRPIRIPPGLKTDHNMVRATLFGIANTPALPSPARGMQHLSIGRRSGETRIETLLRFTPSDVKLFSLTGPHRLIIDMYRPSPKVSAAPISNGLATMALSDNHDKPESYSPPAPVLLADQGQLRPETQNSLSTTVDLSSEKGRTVQHQGSPYYLTLALTVLSAIIVLLVIGLLLATSRPAPSE